MHLNPKAPTSLVRPLQGTLYRTVIGSLVASLLVFSTLTASGSEYPPDLVVSITLGWDPPEYNLDGSPADDLAGHKIYVGTASGIYDRVYNAVNQNYFTIPDLHKGMVYFIAVSAYNSAQLEGPKSEEFVWKYKDADLDGISDTWEVAFYGSATGASAHLDSDGDDLTNLQEYVLGTHPLIANAQPDLLVQTISGGIQIRLQAPPAATGPYYEGLTRCASIERTDLAKNVTSTWTALSGYARIPCAGQEIAVPVPTLEGRSAVYRARFWIAPTL